jgi:hypothetical protein
MSLLSDSLRAVVGLFPKEITPADHEAAAKLPERWTARLKHWLGAPQDPWKYREPPADMEKIFQRCAEPMDPLDNAELLKGLGDDDADLVANFVPDIALTRKYIVDSWPAQKLMTLKGPELLELASDEAGDMEAVYAVLNDPAVLLQELDSWTLEAQQATAFRTCYPDLYEWLGETLQKLISERAALHKSWEPLWEQETQVATLKGLPPEEPFMAPTPPALPKTPFQLGDRAATQADLAQQPVGRENAGGSK